MTDLEALKARLRTPGIGAMWGPPPFEEAADAIERLEAETIALTTYRENLRDECRELLAKVERLEAENARLREALAFYADEQAWNQPPVKTIGHELLGPAYENAASKVRMDRGKIARAALKG